MIHGRRILCIASRWDFDPTCKHQIMKHLVQRDNHIVWVNYHGTRRPVLSRRDIGAAWRTLRQACRGATHVSERFTQMTPLLIPGRHEGWLSAVNRRLVIAQIRAVLKRAQRLDPRPLQIWTFAPDVAFLAGQFGEERLVYYCVDEFSAFECLDSATIRRSERELIDRCDVVVTTSEPLFEAKRKLHPNTYLVRHGVDITHFGRALDSVGSVPADIADMASPIFGFFGLFDHWFDEALLADVAAARPDFSFVLIGERRVPLSRLAALPNVRFLGRRPYADLPAYCAAFAAGLLPFKRNEMTRHINPIKLREYLAAGLPVVSTSLPEALRYRPAVRIADDPRSFADALAGVSVAGTVEQRRQIQKMVVDESWSSTVDRLDRIVLSPSPSTPTSRAERAELSVT
ncbi:MAG: glycosyltransferase [Planctomycetes bacterium]|nr:glycosyltransferase [Planctomycetota bacterium]